MTPEMRKALERPFPAAKIKQKRGQGGRTMSYISHGLITERLNDADPSWSWRSIAEHTSTDAQGRLHCEGVTIELTVGGVSRVEAGGPQRQDGFTNEIKNAYSDALKRAAMRFGVALSMWETLVDAEYDEDVHPEYEAGEIATPMRSDAPPRPQPRPTAPTPVRQQSAPQRPAQPATDGPAHQQAMASLHAVAKERGLTHDELHAIVASRGTASVKDLTTAQLVTFRGWLKERTPAQLRAALRKAGVSVPDEPPMSDPTAPLDADMAQVAALTDAQTATRRGTAGSDQWTR